MQATSPSPISYRGTRRACYAGFMTQAAINNLAPLLFVVFQEEFGLSYERLGTLVLFNFCTQLIVDVLCARFAHKIGYRVPMVAAHVFCVLGLVLLGVLPMLLSDAFVGLCVAAIVYAIGGGITDVLISPLIDSLPTPQNAKAASMALGHSFYCWGTLLVVLLSTLLLSWIDRSLWWILPLAWCALPLANALAFARVPLTDMISDERRTKPRTLLARPAFCAMLLLMVCAGASELTVAQWASLYAEQALGLPKMWGDLLLPCLFALAMGVGRLLYGLLGHKINLRGFMLFCGALCVVCYLALCLAPSPAVGVVACALIGFSVSIFWPGTCSLTSGRFSMGGASMFAILAAFGHMGCAAGPWLAGLVTDRADRGLFGRINGALFQSLDGSPLRTGILIGVIFPLVLLAVLLVQRNQKQEGRETGAQKG